MSQQTAAWAGRASAGRTPWSHFCLRQTWTAPSDPSTWKLSPGLGSHQGDFLWKLSRSAPKSRNVIGTRRQERRFASTFRRHLTEQRRQPRFSFYAWPWKFYRIQNIGTDPAKAAGVKTYVLQMLSSNLASTLPSFLERPLRSLDTLECYCYC